MNFFQFLKSDNNDTHDTHITQKDTYKKVSEKVSKKNPEKVLEKVIEKVPEKVSNNKLSNKLLNKLPIKSSNKSSNMTDLNMTEPTHYKKGDFIRIIHLENSPLNNYKGYNGEIRQYVKNSEHAYIVLEAINNSASIKFPVKHFIKIEN